MKHLLPLALLAAGSALAQPAKPVAARTQIPRAEPVSVRRQAMQALEKSIDARLESANPSDPFDLLGFTRGVYLPGYGVVLSAEVALIRVPGLSPFHPKITADERLKFQARKSQALPKLREIMKASMISAAAELRAVPLNENIVFGMTLFYFFGEDTSGLPAQIVMQATRQQLVTQQNPASIKVQDIPHE